MSKLIFKLKQSIKVLLSDKVAITLIAAAYGFIIFQVIKSFLDEIAMYKDAFDYNGNIIISPFRSNIRVPSDITFDCALLYFLLFLFLSFELFSKIRRDGIDEVMEAASGYKGYFSLFLTVTGLNMVLFSGLIAVNAILLTRFDNASGVFLWQIIQQIFFLYFVTGVLASLTGMALAKIRSRLYGLLAVIFCVLLIAQIIQGMLDLENEWAIRFFELFEIYRYREFKPAFGYSFSPGEWARVLLLTVICTAFVWNTYCKKYRKRVTGILIGLTAVILYWYTQSYLNVEKTPENYYKGLTVSEKQADFGIQSYEMDLKMRTKLTAKCKMQVSENELSEYCFTLYHTLKVSKVEDQNGNAREYRQEGDYITVYASGGQSTESLTFYYKGIPDSDSSYAAAKAVYLSGGVMPFYPRAGHLEVFGFQEDDHRYYNYFEYKDSGRPRFDIRLDSKIDVYCNLDRESKNTFTGNAEALILYGGIFVKELQVDDVLIYYPDLSQSVYTKEECVREINWVKEQLKEKGIDFTVPGKLFITEYMNVKGELIYDDFADINGIGYLYTIKK